MTERPLDFDAVLDLCGTQHRRIVLAVLTAQRRSLTMDDLAKTVVKYNHHTPITEVSGETVTAIKTRLHHVHVPKLAAAGLVDYDTDRQLVEPTEGFERVEPHLSAILDADPGLPPLVEL